MNLASEKLNYKHDSHNYSNSISTSAEENNKYSCAANRSRSLHDYPLSKDNNLKD